MRKRNMVVAILVLAVAALTVFLWKPWSKPVEVESRELTILSYGGEFAESQRIVYFAPFEKETGIKVIDMSYGGEYGKLKSAIDAGNVPWDVADIESSALLRGRRDGLFVPIDFGIVKRDELIPEALDEYGVGTDFYSVSLGWNTSKFPASGPTPKDWKDFWDVQRFPGDRTMKKDARFTLEIALMADGVLPNQVYSTGGLDVDRAFRSLDKIKPYVKVWWTSGQQPIQLLADGEVVMAAAFGARIYNAQRQDKLPVAMTWNSGVLDIEYWVVPRGAKNPELAMRFIDFASRADRQAEFPEQIPLGPVNKKAFKLMEPQFARSLNTFHENFQSQLVLNARFWAENEEHLQERFNQWLGN